MITERELAIILHAGLVSHPDGLASCHTCQSLTAMRNKVIELERVQHPAIAMTGRSADPAEVSVAGEPELYAAWRAMLNEAGPS